jgi:microcin C transport system substrate-binding protein
MNSTIMYSQYFLHRSYYEDLYTPENPCKNPYFEFSKDKARQLLQAAGWTANAKSGILEKGGRPFRFTFLNREESSNKFLAIYREDLKDVGIDMKIEVKDGAAWTKDMHEFKYDMTWAAWSGGLFKDPEEMWASAEADRKSGSNITGFKDAKVDALIEKQRTLFDVAQRNAICREIDSLVAGQCPYALLWNLNYVRLLYWNRFGTPRTVLSKYGDEQSAYSLWWPDEDSAADLKQAMDKGLPLPARKDSVKFDDEFPRAAGLQAPASR